VFSRKKQIKGKVKRRSGREKLNSAKSKTAEKRG